MIAAFIVASMGLSFAGLDAGPPTFSGLDADSGISVRPYRKASFVREVEPPRVYSLADTAGNTWTHADPDYLRRWVADRNEARTRYGVPSVTYSVARPVYAGGFYASYGYSAGSCASGNCARR